MLHRLLTLARVSNLPTVWSNCLAAWLISGAEPSWRLLWLLAGASLLYAAGCTLNDAFDAKWDAQHRPERLIPSGSLSRRAVWGLGLTELAAGLALTYAGGVSVWWPPLALAGAILLYDAWHKQSPLSVVVMGACRWLLYLTAAACAGGELRTVMLFGAVLWVYIIVLSLVARREAQRDSRTPRTGLLLLGPPLALVVAVLSRDARDWPGAAVVALLLWEGTMSFLPEGKVPVGVVVNRLLAAIPLVDFCLVAAWAITASPPFHWMQAAAVVVFAAAVVLSLHFQKRFQAT